MYIFFRTGGTTDYAVDIYREALLRGTYASPLKAGTRLPMMFMEDALTAVLRLMEAPAEKLRHFNAFNVHAMSFAPEEVAAAIRKRLPDFTLAYAVNPQLQAIAESWPDRLDDSAAREEWGWAPQYDLERMTDVMLKELPRRLRAR